MDNELILSDAQLEAFNGDSVAYERWDTITGCIVLGHDARQEQASSP